jgi:hypothetical protein
VNLFFDGFFVFLALLLPGLIVSAMQNFPECFFFFFLLSNWLEVCAIKPVSPHVRKFIVPKSRCRMDDHRALMIEEAESTAVHLFRVVGSWGRSTEGDGCVAYGRTAP